MLNGETKLEYNNGLLKEPKFWLFKLFFPLC